MRKILLTTLALASTTACSPPPHAVLIIEDPQAVATAATTLLVGPDFERLQSVELAESLSFATTITLQSDSPGERELVVEARDDTGHAMARGRGTIVLQRRSPSATFISLTPACSTDTECEDEIFCDGTGHCLQGLCAYKEACGSSFGCVTSTCIESERRCEVSVLHNFCGEDEYCDPVHGCIPGEPCMTTLDCDDNLPCNGQEECIGFRCRSGIPINPTDSDPCTLDGCDDNRVAEGLDPAFNVPDPSTDGNRCTLEGSGTEGICRFSPGGCVISACGDGFVDTALLGEVCDEGPGNSDLWGAAPRCNITCDGLAPHCGDETIDGGNEVCDDGALGFDGWRNEPHCNSTCDSIAPHCGDGIVAAGFEGCDEGAGNSDGWSASGHCNALCSGLAARCGDGIIEAGFEICDDGPGNGDSWSPDPHCNSTCSGWAAHCGDGATSVGLELCDDGVRNSNGWSPTPHCNATCDNQGPTCGDAVLDSAFEACDEGGANSNAWAIGPHCNASCSGVADYCGDGRVSLGNETCDDDNDDGWAVTAHCNSSCSGPAPYCGDGAVAAGKENCDDGAANSDQWSADPHCSSTCAGPGPSCGDGLVSLGNEVCDDGAANTDAWASIPSCNADCVGQAPHCGDGIVDIGFETCDDGADNSGGWSLQSTCNSTCNGLTAYCGDGVLDVGDEVCDDGVNNDDSWALTSHCNESCTGLAPHCGDNLLESGIETCDDGAVNSDGWQPTAHCNANCSGQATYCGDQLVSPGNESCDDGSLNDDNWGAQPHCNSTCTGPGPSCGDGELQGAHEQCDDGVHADTGNGCSDTCQDNHVCGDGIVQTWFEQCEDPQSGDNCDSCRDDCTVGCICATAQGCDAAGEWCEEGTCQTCDTDTNCGLNCEPCPETRPTCGGPIVGCTCETTPAPHGTCRSGSYCDGAACATCDTAQRCGPDCVACAGSTPACAGADVGCIVDPPGSCAGMPDYTRCQVITSPDREYDVCIDGSCVSPGCGDRSCNAKGVSFQLADSNQRSCYDFTGGIDCPGTAGSVACATTPSCGQDAQYGWDTQHTEAERYFRTEPVVQQAVVTDNVTGLVWQGCAAGTSGIDCDVGQAIKPTWQAAFAYCDDLDWGGQRDWRVPSLNELLSSVSYDQGAPTIDLVAFAAIPNDSWPYFWTSTYADNSFYGFESSPIVIDFRGARVHYSQGVTAFTYTRCVRQDLSRTLLIAQRFEATEQVSGEPVVVDHVTGLDWQGCLAGRSGKSCNSGSEVELGWPDALARCEGLDWGGYTDWYLPNLPALASIVDDTAGPPFLDATVFPRTPIDDFTFTLSSTVVVAGLPGDRATWSIHVKSGSIETFDVTGHFRCARTR